MAIQLNTAYTGRINDIIYYERLGDYLLRTVPMQATNSIRSASAFGKAASAARKLRVLLAPLIPNPRDKAMQNRLTVAVRQFLATAENGSVTDLQNNPLAGFSFAADTALRASLLFPLDIVETAEGTISIGIPAINPLAAITAPAGTTRVVLSFISVTIHPDNELAFASSPVLLEIPYADGVLDSQTLELDSGSMPGGISVVAVSVSYWDAASLINAAGIKSGEILFAVSS
ncbi:hypothetical protein GZH53_09205 [Flavihumibacter sp. R14]|nr:hypothetical protein [Flavihumibacter soli]